MAHKKWYYVLFALVIVMVFGTAAVCNMCGAGSATTEKTGTDEETAAASTAKAAESTTGEEDKDTAAESTAKPSATETSGPATESTTAAATTLSDKVAPTIVLEIYEGPTYSAADEICYYRIQAKVKGNPAPSVTFSKDDSGGAWGSKKVQVNINDPGDTYTLTATATNSEGSDTDSIEISWGCPIPDPEPIQKDVNIGVDKSKSGYIIVDMGAYIGDTYVYTFVGDYTNDKQIKTYLTFDIEDISDLDDVTIKEASLIMPVDAIVAHPELMPEVHVRIFDYGSTLELADQGAGGEFVKTFPATNPMASFNFSGSDLESALQDAVDAGDNRFQLKISLAGINADGIDDYYGFMLGDIKLSVEYEIPG